MGFPQYNQGIAEQWSYVNQWVVLQSGGWDVCFSSQTSQSRIRIRCGACVCIVTLKINWRTVKSKRTNLRIKKKYDKCSIYAECVRSKLTNFLLYPNAACIIRHECFQWNSKNIFLFLCDSLQILIHLINYQRFATYEYNNTHPLFPLLLLLWCCWPFCIL